MIETPNPFFSVVIPTYQRPDTLAKTLLRIEPSQRDALPYECEVVVSDDSADDATRRLIESEFPWVRWIQGPRKGPAANRNCGAQQSRGAWLVFTDDDCLPTDGWLNAFFNKIDCGDVLEGKTIAERAKRSLDEESPVNLDGGYLWSCNFAIRRDLFYGVGGFNDAFPYAAMEDVELRERLLAKGYALQFCPDALVVHPWRKCKGILHRKRELESWYLMLKLHPHLRPRSYAEYFFHRSFRSFIKVTLPQGLRFSLRGMCYALSVDAFYFWQGLKALLRPTRHP